MNKTEFVEAVAETSGMTKVDAAAAVNAVLAGVKTVLKKGGTIELQGFGVFEVVAHAARTAYKPGTGEPVQVPAKNVPKFRAGKDLKDAVQGVAVTA